jgi:hypothetical protein
MTAGLFAYFLFVHVVPFTSASYDYVVPTIDLAQCRSQEVSEIVELELKYSGNLTVTTHCEPRNEKNINTTIISNSQTR